MVTQCAIMPPIAAVFTVKEHMLLKIIIYLFQFLLCSIQVILASLLMEQAQTTTFHNRPHNYKKNMQFSLPSQQSAFNATQQHQQWPLPPKPTPPMTGRGQLSSKIDDL